MPNRNFPNNTSCSQHLNKTAAVLPLNPALTGHTIIVYADFAVYDVTTGNYILPENVSTEVNGLVRRGLIQ